MTIIRSYQDDYHKLFNLLQQKKIIVYKSVDASYHFHDTLYIQDPWRLVDKVGEKCIVQDCKWSPIMTLTSKRASKSLDNRRRLFWTWCMAHCIHLMIKDIGDIGLAKRTEAITESITHSFIIITGCMQKYKDIW